MECRLEVAFRIVDMEKQLKNNPCLGYKNKKCFSSRAFSTEAAEQGQFGEKDEFKKII